jgi:hypothetical protein
MKRCFPCLYSCFKYTGLKKKSSILKGIQCAPNNCRGYGRAHLVTGASMSKMEKSYETKTAV